MLVVGHSIVVVNGGVDTSVTLILVENDTFSPGQGPPKSVLVSTELGSASEVGLSTRLKPLEIETRYARFDQHLRCDINCRIIAIRCRT